MTPEAIELARSNLGAYYLLQHPNYGHYAFQQNCIIPALHRLADQNIEALAILMPPRHGKTDLATLNFLAFCFGYWPDRSNMLLSYSDKYAKRFGRKILNLCQTDIHKTVFPQSSISSTARSASYFVTTEGGEFFSAGFSGTITGAGVDGVLVIDDPLKNMEEARSTVVLEARMEDYRSAAKTRLEGGVKLMCLTRWAKNDFFDRVIDEDGTVEEGGAWEVLKIPAEAGDDDGLDRAPGKFLWPEHFRGGDRHYLELKRDTRTWNALFQQDPQPEKGRFFKREWLNFYPNAVKPMKFPAYMICDPGKGKENRHDRTAIGVFVANSDKRVLLVDAALGRFDPDERTAHLFRLKRKWNPIRFIYEEYGLLSDTWYLDQAAKRLGIRLYPIPVGRKGPRHMLSKETRIEGLIPDFREGRIWLPDPDTVPFPTVKLHEEEGSEEISIIDYFINFEYLEYAGENSVPHDDLLDAMARLHEPELGIQYPSGPAVDSARLIERNRPRRGTWESTL